MFTESHEIEPNSISGIECMKYVLTMNGGINKIFYSNWNWRNRYKWKEIYKTFLETQFCYLGLRSYGILYRISK